MIRDRILSCFQNAGVEINKINTNEDCDLREYIADSVAFIAAIVEIENEFDIEIPDEFLIYERFASLNSFCEAISLLLNT